MELVAGVDEAGRGPVLGPMVIACVVFSSKSLAVLRRVGVIDSKRLTPRRRKSLYRRIVELSDEYRVRIVGVGEIDNAVLGLGDANLNHLEARITAEILCSLRSAPSVVYLDSPDPRPERYAELVRRAMRCELKTEIVAECSADEKYLPVSAASIVAKVVRDLEIRRLRREYGDVGSGYPSDPRTIEFLRRWLEERKELPPIVRKSWKTVRNLMREFSREP